ncbi:twin-arginine translocation signal domain-containing protein [Mucilaginibacter mali]|uniref:Twin-arginine translocation signal domain-containing protein n=1 Tax=Mucilaginibacter mali TaxID=2740462 RepID=A0A7D4Q3L2_9SPHI|nr:twin-arginine translocation signal domain-containing protein [Mucilaginibacter mali]QKJ32266.1 twin-arginine translocation signal domain-containing protein [Mucilaginibacter mali]
MHDQQSRRHFIKTSAIVGAGLAGAFKLSDAWALNQNTQDLYALSSQLVRQWAETLLAMQITDKRRADDYGGIWCPADKAVHGRVGDTIYPFFYMAAQTKDSRYTDAAMLLYRWIERRVSQPDGSWLNESVKGSWKGTTVFMSIALAEALKHHADLMDAAFKTELSTRLKKASDFIYDTFNINFGNINYPITASYGLSLLGEVLDEPKFKTKGRELAHQAMAFITPKDGFLKGEGDPYYEASKKGCFSVDLGYNVEESLPSLAQYGLLTKDEEVLQQVSRSLQTHMELMLPDGGWDNSWGTRNYKWTYWGSRTSDGCQPAYALLADRDARFYKAALLNTQLMQRSTIKGLLQGGPHFATHGVPVCVHHTFTHIKALITVLEHQPKKVDLSGVEIPREKAYGLKSFSDIQTWLVAKGDYRATVTGYDRDYKHTPNGHASGGALTMLWHKKTGPILCASMNEYQMVEAGNQQVETDLHAMSLTPRIEMRMDDKLYMNISDHDAVITTQESGDKITIKTRAKLVDRDLKDPSIGPVNCEVDYEFTPDKVSIHFRHYLLQAESLIKIIIPVIAKSTEKVTVAGNNKSLQVNREGGIVKLTSDQPLLKLPTTNGRVFNFVPGFEALPLGVEQNEVRLEISVS